MKIGSRVQLHAATSEWMQGDRYGVVVGFGRARDYIDTFTKKIIRARPVRVKLDKSGRVRRFHPDHLFEIEGNPRRRSGLEGDRWRLRSGKQLLAQLAGVLGRDRIERVARILANSLRKRVTIVEPGRASNPTMHHHSVVGPAAFHLFLKKGDRQFALADVYTHSQPLAAKIAETFATALSVPVSMIEQKPGTIRHDLTPDQAARGAKAWSEHLRKPYSTVRPSKFPLPGIGVSQKNPGRLKWHETAGGTGAWEGAKGYTAHVGWADYRISPTTTPHGRRAGYIVQANRTREPAPPNAFAHGGLWHDLGRARSPAAAKRIALEHYQRATSEPNPKRVRVAAVGGRRGKRKRKRNPSPAPSVSHAARRTFRKWHEFDPESVRRMSTRPVPRELVVLGEIPEFVYTSDKWTGKNVTYSHRTRKPRPLLCTGADGKGLFIVGGQTRATRDGLVD